MPNAADFNRFTYAPTSIDIGRSMFDVKHTVKFSCNVGECIPFFYADVLPGDTFNIETTKVIRLQPLVAPIMDEVILDTYYFFVPNRLVWSHWINFMGENTSTAWTPQVEYNIPQITIPEGGFDIGTIADYLGVPPKQGEGVDISALPFRAYALIMDQWFRSEALMDPVHVHLDDTTRTGVNTDDQVTDIEKGGKPFIACKFFDQFTAALPEPQYGSAVNVALFSELPPAPVYTGEPRFLGGQSVNKAKNSAGDYYTPLQGVTAGRNLTSGDTFTYLGGTAAKQFDLGLALEPYSGQSTSGAVANRTGTGSNITDNVIENAFYPSNLYADLAASFTAGQAFTVNDLRTAFAVQRYLEKQARSGSRYIETIKAFFNVDSPDARLQRSEYLGGSRLPLNINSIEQTSATVNGQTPQGNPSGLSVTGDQNSDFIKSFTEHGMIIGIAVARYHHSYQNGLERHWRRKTIYDFYNPVFANLGEQGIKNSEMYLTPKDISQDEQWNDQNFGYQEAWYDYRYFPNRIAGEMRSKATTPLDMWHLADNYTDSPYLSAAWIREDKTPLDRCLAVTSAVSNQIICDFLIDGTMTRPMPAYSIPGLIDHH